ncbi:MAG: NPCBM/NEW2 domain-containing protein, partial [Verrucomicrobiota bacterium]
AAVQQLKAETDFRGVTISWAPDAADSYRVQRSDGPVFETNVSFIKDPAVKVGNSYQYQVAALGWTGKASAPSTIETTPKAPECPPTPPEPTVLLDDLTALEVKNGWGKAIAGKSISGGPLQINGKIYARGIGAHAPAVSVYSVPTGATRFVAVVGLDDAVKRDGRASVVFQVYGDMKEMGEKPVLIGESPVLSDKTVRFWAFNLELNTRFKQLRLVVTDAGDGYSADHADWVDAGFISAAQNP